MSPPRSHFRDAVGLLKGGDNYHRCYVQNIKRALEIRDEQLWAFVTGNYVRPVYQLQHPILSESRQNTLG